MRRRKAAVRKSTRKLPLKKRKTRTLRRRVAKPSPLWTALIRRAGSRYALDHPPAEGQDAQVYVNSLWYGCYMSEGRRIPHTQYAACADAFLEGYFSQLGRAKPDWALVPTKKSIAAVVTAFNEEKTIEAVLNQLHRMPVREIIVVVNGSTDSSFALARRSARATVVHYPNSLGHDVGRSIGARLSGSDMVLFLDGDIPIMAEQLAPFIRAIDHGADVALNDMTPHFGPFFTRDGVTIMKEFLNTVQGRPDLKSNSMTAIPHILSRKAIEQIGAANLVVPPKAQSLALELGLVVVAAGSVDVIKGNKVTRFNTGIANPVSNLIIGDHLEAVHTLLKRHASRLNYKDVMRKRAKLQGGTT